MTRASNLRTGGQILVDQLEIHGVDLAFGVPGESYLALLDALYDSAIRYIVCRQEGGAAMMAEAYGKLTGRPGIAMVTRGPGATNAAHGVHIARQDSTPMILLIGQVARGMRGREAFQEIDYRAMFGVAGQMGVRDRRPGAHSGDDQPRVPHRGLRPAGPRGDRAAGGHADRAGGLRRCGALPASRRRIRRPPTWRACGNCSPRRSARSWSWAAAAGAPRHAPTSRRSPRSSTCRSACRSAARTISTTPMPTTPVTSASRWRRL